MRLVRGAVWIGSLALAVSGRLSKDLLGVQWLSTRQRVLVTVLAVGVAVLAVVWPRVPGWAGRLRLRRRLRPWQGTPLERGDPPRAGGYRLRRRLGAGTADDVFLSEAADGTQVAVKVIRPAFHALPEFRTRFAAEVLATRRLRSRYVPRLVDHDPVGDPPWLATEFVPGPTLQQIVDKGGRLPEAQVCRLAEDLGGALADIHAADLVHRDVKPANVLVTADRVFLVDLGIVRAVAAAPVTHTGELLGTAEYMSPEQAESDPAGHPVGTPSDVFSLGAVLAYAATGRPPFTAETRIGVLRQVIRGEPDLDGIEGGLLDLVRDCLHTRPAARPTAEEVVRRARELRAAATAKGTTPTLIPGLAELAGGWAPKGPQPEGSPPWAHAVVVVVTILFGGLTLVPWPTPGDGPHALASPGPSTTLPRVSGTPGATDRPGTPGPSPTTTSTGTPGGAPSPTPVPPPTPGSGVPQPDPGVLESNPDVRLGGAQSTVVIDYWGKGNPAPDLWRDGTGLYTRLGALLAPAGEGTDPSYDQCYRATGWTDRIALAALRPGSRLCLYSYSGRYARISVTSVPPTEPDPLVFAGQTWQRAPESAPGLREHNPGVRLGGGDPTVMSDYWRSGDPAPDLGKDAAGLYTTRGAQLAVLPGDTDPTYPDCQRATGWTDRVAVGQLRVGARLCLRTQESFLGRIRIRSLPAPDLDYVVLDGYTWNY
ncbi:serine/threonine-protein kinase [Longispora sp. K20-0274]|uniref:serine/threonine-protein kinase n=1 Tax=Longispora sp. K20-0274 TaxID=3088255 RepID=UPI00399B6962